MTMVNSVSNIRFCGGAEMANLLSRPGKYSSGETQTYAAAEAPAATAAKKKSGGKLFLKTIIGLAVIAAGLVALPKLFPKAIKTLESEALKNAKFKEKLGHYLAKTGDFIGKYTYEPIAKLFNGKKAKLNTVA